jgi:hypothetical protein
VGSEGLRQVGDVAVGVGDVGDPLAPGHVVRRTLGVAAEGLHAGVTGEAQLGVAEREADVEGGTVVRKARVLLGARWFPRVGGRPPEDELT